MLIQKNLIMTFIVSTLLLAMSICPAIANDSDIKVMTIAEIYANKDALKGKKVRVKGNVVKVSRNIMKRNWIHVKDGTGTPGKDKIIFRSEKAFVAVGSEVEAQGIVDTDLDFGYGYTYEVLVEDAEFTK